ncbi:MAG: molybdenum cofactor biosynthesis protein MoaE [Xanthomonadales bacterium]|jgi:molybdopterin synthase catalytic subunit|nr:molybdenum cofactor biosynthesis protein MoaE [Xanthomonadales bacterium]
MNDFKVTAETIDLALFRATMQDVSCGAYVQFDGWVRDHNEGQKVLRLEYEVYEPLAVKEGERILAEARERFGVSRTAVIHRSGLMELSDTAVVVGVASPHRDEAFEACRYIIDQVKVRLPIWKKEHYASGHAEWVNCQRCAQHKQERGARD